MCITIFKMKRVRAPNFTNAEILHLLLLIEKYPIIENKKTDMVTCKDKQDAWQALTHEYNSSTPGCPRTVVNLIACYKNQKIKVKKQHSNVKMTIKAPDLSVEPCTSKKNIEKILDGVQNHGQDWSRIAEDIPNVAIQECEIIFNDLSKQAKKQSADFIRELKCTGGGPPPQPPNDVIMEKVKSLMGPSIEGLYTIYDGDAQFMEQQQEQLPIAERLKPIDFSPTFNIDTNSCDGALDEVKKTIQSPLLASSTTSTPYDPKRLKLLRKRLDPSLDTAQDSIKGKKKNVSDAFMMLTNEKRELVKIKMQIAESQLLHLQQLHQLQEIQLNIAQENLKHIKEKNALEIEHLKEKQKYEIEILKNK